MLDHCKTSMKPNSIQKDFNPQQQQSMAIAFQVAVPETEDFKLWDLVLENIIWILQKPSVTDLAPLGTLLALVP